MKVRIGFDKLDPRILPEMSVKVAFHEPGSSAASTARGVTVPTSAIQHENGRDIVLVIQNNHAEPRAVSVSATTASDGVIAAGLAAGEKVIINPPANLKPGSLVRETK